MAVSSSDMCEGPLLKKIISYTVPIILTGLLQLLFNAADLVVVGNFSGSISVAAVGATGSIINLIVNLFIGLSVGAGVCVAHAIGANDLEAQHDTVHTAIPAAIISGVFLTIIGVTCARFFLELMGTPEDVIDLSATYMRIYFMGMTASMIYNFGAAILRAAGDTKGPLYFLTTAGVLNVILNLIFVIVFKMAVAGVAFATIISQALSAFLVVVALIKREDGCKLILSDMRIHKKPLIKMIKIGVPAGIQGSLFSISNVLIQSSINSFGSVVMSGNAAAANLEGFVYVTMNAFHQTALNFVGQNMGARKYDRLGKILFQCLASVATVGLVAGGLVYLFGEPLLGIYINDSLDAIGYGLNRLLFICLPYFLCGLMDVTTGAIRGMGASLVPMIITVAGVCVMRIVWIYTVFAIPEYHTLDVLYASYPISWVLTFVAEVIAFFAIRNRLIKKQLNNNI